ncbi:hypothetical protein BRARA_H01381 [Brassica rapa]|uniref:Uncharacterized protein n=2 Tax=Brassica TaxID=3705 RepID=A0A397YB50_BRACM|nr:hypothetical protein BRARA_H01381 [Brassica rapa]CAF2242679.1 unnamed protein product [Brassica napus]CDY23270.1 BnaA08g12760D [Brassica napus]
MQTQISWSFLVESVMAKFCVYLLEASHRISSLARRCESFQDRRRTREGGTVKRCNQAKKEVDGSRSGDFPAKPEPFSSDPETSIATQGCTCRSSVKVLLLRNTCFSWILILCIGLRLG